MIWGLTGLYLVIIFVIVMLALYLNRAYYALLENPPKGKPWAAKAFLIAWCGALALIFFGYTWLYTILALHITIPNF